MRSSVLLSLMCLLLASLPMRGAGGDVSYTREDSLRVVELLELGAKEMAKAQTANVQSSTVNRQCSMVNRQRSMVNLQCSMFNVQRSMFNVQRLVLFYARQLMNLPYVAHTLEIKDKEEHLAVNLQSLDCTTLVENVCALALTTSHGSKRWQDYLSWLRKLRYQDGRIAGYSSRNHYFSQWIQSGERLGLVREVVPNGSISVPMKLSLTYMSSHPDSYPLLKVNMEERRLIAEMEKRASGATVRYIPKERVGDSRKVLSCVHDGDIIAITTKKAGLDVSHVGFAVWGEDGKLHLLNASSIHKKVVLEPMTLYEYMQKHSTQTGIRVIRLQQ